MTDFLLHIGWLTLSMSAIILFVLLFNKLFGGKFSARSRYTVWTLIVLSLTFGIALFRLPSLFTFEVTVPRLEEEADEPPYEQDTVSGDLTGNLTGDLPVETPTNSPVTNVSPPSEEIPPTFVPNTQTGTISPDLIENDPLPTPEELPADSSTDASAEKSLSVDIPVIIFTVWMSGAALFFSLSIAVYMRSTHKLSRGKKMCAPETEQIFNSLCKKHGIGRAPRLYICENTASPVLYGYFRPTVLLPGIPLSQNAKISVLSHELTHYRRGDIWVKLTCLIAESIHWFNPLVHLAAARCNAEMELSCDEAVLHGMSDNVRRSYGNIMLDIVKNCSHKRSVLTTHYSPQKNAVKERLMNILDMTKKSRGRIIIASVLALCIIFGTVIGCSVKRENTDEEPDESVYLNAEALTEHIIHYVMEKDWIEGETAILENDVTKFLTTIRLYVSKDQINPHYNSHPYDELVAIADDGEYDLLTLADAKKISSEVFSYDTWTGELSYLKDYFDSDTETYMIPKSVGLWSSPFSFENMDATYENGLMYVECDLVNSTFYEYEEADYGRYRFTFKYVTEDSGNYLRFVGVEKAWDVVEYENLSDFLTDEQIEVFETADVLFPLFNGHADNIDSLHLDLENADFDTVQAYLAARHSSIPSESVKMDNGTYRSVRGEYDTYEKFESLCLSVFTREYFDELNRVTFTATNEEYSCFIDIDGKFYYFDTAKGTSWGYAGYQYPDTYELVSKTEDEIRFNVIGYFKSSHVSPIYTVDAQTYSVTLVRTGDGWRFSHFSDPLHSMYDSREATVFSSYFGKGSIDELMELDITYNGEETTLGAWVENSNFSPIKYSVIDLDGDGEHEMVFWLAVGINEGAGYLVLHDENGTVYAHVQPYRGFRDLKADGRFSLSGGAAISGIGKLEFSGDSYVSVTLVYREADMNDHTGGTVEYTTVLDGYDEFGEAEYNAYYEEWESTPEAVWYDIEIKRDESENVSGSYFGKGSIEELMELDITYNGEETTLGAWVEETDYEPIKYTVVDLNSDEEHEMVLWLSYYTNEYDGFLVLHEEDGTVYAYMLSYRQFFELKSDGTFSFSGSSPDGIGRLSFAGGSYEVKNLVHSVNPYPISDRILYYIDGEEVTEDEYNAKLTEQSEKPSATWYDMPEVTAEVIYTYDVTLADGSVKTLEFTDGYDPALYAESYTAQIDNTGVPNTVILHKIYGGTGVFVNRPYVLDGTTGEQIPVRPVDEVIRDYVNITSSDEGWTVSIRGENHLIKRSQFADYPDDMIADSPDLSLINHFYVEDGQLICKVGILCAGNGTGFAKEYIYISYGYDSGTIRPFEVTVKRENSIPQSASYIKVEEISALPVDPSDAWRIYYPMMSAIYYFFDSGLTYYCRYEYNGEHFEKNTLILPEGYTNGEIFYVRGTGGSAEMYIIVKTDQGYLRYYSTVSHCPDEILSVTELTDDELEYEKSCMENDQMFMSQNVESSASSQLYRFLDMTFSEIEAAGYTLEHLQGNNGWAGWPSYSISGYVSVTLTFQVSYREATREHLINVIPDGVEITNPNITINGLRVSMTGEEAKKAVTSWGDVFFSHENGGPNYVTTYNNNGYKITAYWAMPEDMYNNLLASLPKEWGDEAYVEAKKQLIEPFKDDPVGEIIVLNIEKASEDGITISPTYTVENTDGSVICLYSGTNKLTAIPSDDGLIDFDNIPKNIFDEHYGDTGGDFEIAVGGAVLSVHQYDSRYYNSVELHLNSITYSGRTVTLNSPIALSGNIGIVAFESDGAFVFMKQYYGDGEGYIIKDGAVYAIRNYSGSAFYDVSGVLSLYKGEDGEIMYKRIAEEFNTAAQSDYIILMNLTSRDQYYGEEGTVEVADGRLTFTRTKLYTVSDYFEARGTTIDEWFENFDRSEFDKIFTNVSDPEDVTLKDVFEHNLSGRDDDRAATAKEHFEAVLAGEEKVYFADGKSEFLALCQTYYLQVYMYPNKIAYVDFDGDGVDELIVQSAAYGEHILQYDFEDERVYAVFISPRGGYVYFANGEIAHSYENDILRYVVTKLSKGEIELEEVRYTDTEPDRTAVTWTEVELQNPNEN